MDVARRHKASWMELGQHLYTIHKERLYKAWGYIEFDSYCRKELRIKATTASKLLKSYHFLEREEPDMVKQSFSENTEPRKIPDYESVNVLRLAKKNKSLTEGDYNDLKESVFEKAGEPKDVRVQMRKLLSDREVVDPKVERNNRRNATIKRLITVLVSGQKQLESENLVPAYVIKQISELAQKLEAQLE